MRKVEVPAPVLSRSPGTLVAVVIRSELDLFLRETDWGLKRYPSGCPAELRLGTWEIDGAFLIALILRLARSDASTFDYQIDVRTAAGLKMLECLAAQSQIDLHLVADEAVRTLRAANPACAKAERLREQLRAHSPWTAEDTERALTRLNTLYPTPRDLWWNCAPGGKP